MGAKLLYMTALTIAFLVIPAMAQIENVECLDCHERAEGEESGSYEHAIDYSIHASMDCTDCHDAITELPHEEKLEKVNCGLCHEEEDEVYQWHGRIKREESIDIPRCANCHGRHDIRPSEDRESRVNPLHLPETCGRCHENIDLTTKYEMLYGKAIEMYNGSVHGKASLGGVYLAATCNDCHSTGGTAHRILSPGMAESSINHFNIPKTCGKCHQNVEKDFWEGIHGKLVARGETDSPVCTNCHGEHGIIAPSDPRSTVSPSRVAEATCSPCHESAFINAKYGVAADRLRSWYDSYHGLKSKAGDKTVANCASCHGAHRILPHTDTTSSIYSGNLQHTCGQCHPGISTDMAQTPIHATPGVGRTPAANVVRIIYLFIIFLTIGGMILHWVIDLRKEIKKINQKPQIQRMTNNEVWQHTFLTVSFLALVFSGFALRFSDAFWVKWLFGWEGGFPFRGVLHRISAVILILTSVWHLFYLRTDRGKQFLKDMLPTKTDFHHLIQLNRYNLGRCKEKPRFGRFIYIEKFEYWALIWGTVVMIITGILLWFDNLAMIWVPKGFLDIVLVVHYYEAWLATLAILVWHLYSTVFNPGVYPMNPAWYTGKMPIDLYRHEHPADPIFKDEKRSIPAGDKEDL